MKASRKILILTSGYGDGHNSAARGIAEALAGRAECRIVDVYKESMPSFFRVSRAAYVWMIHHAPELWREVYQWSDRLDCSQVPTLQMPPAPGYLSQLIKGWQPDVIVSTYMIYPYLLDRILEREGLRIPYMTVVTDSLSINRTWLCCRSNLWCVTDNWTREVLVSRGIPEDKIRTTGFPVSPSIICRSRTETQSWKPGSPFRILYFAGGTAEAIEKDVLAALRAHPDIRITCVMGRRCRNLYPRLHAFRKSLGSPARFRLLGWTTRVPEFLATHHLVVGKAGGATTHEIIAAGKPMLVNFRVPGQEEGNAELLERLGGGRCVESAGELGDALRAMLADDGRLWKGMRQALLDAAMTGGSDKIASLALQLSES